MNHRIETEVRRMNIMMVYTKQRAIPSNDMRPPPSTDMIMSMWKAIIDSDIENKACGQFRDDE